MENEILREWRDGECGQGGDGFSSRDGSGFDARRRIGVKDAAFGIDLQGLEIVFGKVETSEPAEGATARSVRELFETLTELAGREFRGAIDGAGRKLPGALRLLPKTAWFPENDEEEERHERWRSSDEART